MPFEKLCQWATLKPLVFGNNGAVVGITVMLVIVEKPIHRRGVVSTFSSLLSVLMLISGLIVKSAAPVVSIPVACPTLSTGCWVVAEEINREARLVGEPDHVAPKPR